MRKSILIGVLAALMLFAFTACEPQVIEYPTEAASFGVRTVGDTTYLEGEDFDFRGLEVVQIYKDGSTKPVAVEDLTVSGGEDLSSSSKVAIKYLGTEVIKDLSPVVKEINAIAVDDSTAKTQYVSGAGDDEDTTSFDKTGLVVTGQYKEGETVVLSRVLDADEYTVKFDSQATSAGTEQTATVTLTGESVTTTFKLTTAEDEVEKIELVPIKESVYFGDSKALATNFTVTATFKSGNVDKNYAASNLVYEAAQFENTFTKDDLDKAWSVKVYVKDHESVFDTDSSYIPRDYYSQLTVTSPTQEEYEATKGQNIDLSEIKVTGTLASDSQKTENVTSFTLDDAYISLFEEAESVTRTVKAVKNGKEATATVTIYVDQPEA